MLHIFSLYFCLQAAIIYFVLSSSRWLWTWLLAFLKPLFVKAILRILFFWLTGYKLGEKIIFHFLINLFGSLIIKSIFNFFQVSFKSLAIKIVVYSAEGFVGHVDIWVNYAFPLEGISNILLIGLSLFYFVTVLVILGELDPRDSIIFIVVRQDLPQ